MPVRYCAVYCAAMVGGRDCHVNDGCLLPAKFSIVHFFKCDILLFLRIDVGRMAEYSTDVLSEVFSFGDMVYFVGIKLFNRVIDRLEINMEQQKRYGVFDRIYEEGMQKKDYKYDRYTR